MQPRTRPISFLALPLAALLFLSLVGVACRELHPLTKLYRGEPHFRGINTTRQEQQVVPEGTKIHVRLTDPIAIGSPGAGKRFEGKLDRELKLNGESILPQGTPVVGRLTKVLESPSGKGLTEIGLVIEAIIFRGKEVKIKTETLTFQLPPPDATLASGIATRGIVYEPGTRLTFKLVKPLRLPVDPRTGWLPALSPLARARAAG